MALIDLEGFDSFTTTAQARKALWMPVETGISFITGRDDRGKAMFINNSSTQIVFALPGVDTRTYVVGFAFRFDLTSAVFCRIVGERSTELELEVTSGGELKLDRGTFTQIDITSGLGLSGGQWYFIEFKFKINDTTGLYNVRVNGNSVMSNTNVDTKGSSGSGRGTPVYLSLIGRSAATNWDFDDLYMLDDTGTSNTDFLGDSIVEPLYPNSDGTTNQFTPLSGLTNYEMVDDGDNPDDGTTYVASSTVNHVDLYGHAGLQEVVDTIYGVRAQANVWVSSPGPRQVRTLIRSGGTNYEGEAFGCAASYKYARHIWEQDPNTAAAWTESGINSAEFGVTIES